MRTKGYYAAKEKDVWLQMANNGAWPALKGLKCCLPTHEV
jgi:hypothetical protein